MKNKSAKDLAFDRERAKYKRQIDELKEQLKQKDMELRDQRKLTDEANDKCEQLQDWIDRLLEYTELSKEDLMAVIQKEKDSAEVAANLKSMLGVMRGFGTYF